MAVEFLEIKVQLDGADEATAQLNNLKKAVRGVSNSAKETEETADKASESVKKSASWMGKLVKSLGRVAFYRAIRTAIKEVKDALGEGLENAYFYSKTLNGSLYQSLNNIASASEKMKNQLGAAFGTLLVQLTPVIVGFINLITAAVDKLTQFFAALGGQSTYLKAKDVTKEWAEETSKGASAAEEWKNQLLGFDEINRLEDNDTGGSGGSSSTNYGDLFEEVPLDNWALKIKDFTDWLRGILGGFFEDFSGWCGEAVATVAYTLSTIWEKIREFSANAWATMVLGAETIGESLRGILADVELFADSVCDTIENMMVTVATIASEKLESISEDVSEAFNHIFSKTQSTFSNISIYTTTFLGAITAVLGNAIKNCHGLLENAAGNIGSFVSKTYTSVASWAKASANAAVVWGQSIAESVYEGLSNAWGNINSFITGTLEGFGSWANGVASMFCQAAVSAVNAISSMAATAWSKISSFASSVGQRLSGWWSDNGGTVLQIGAGVAIVGATVGAIALAVPSLGSSVAALGASLSSIGGLAAIGAFSNGGFPEDGLFMANHGELVGQFSNGKTAVANNGQIIEGIRQGVYEATMAAINNGNLPTAQDVRDSKQSIYLDGKMLNKSIQQYQRAYGT